MAMTSAQREAFRAEIRKAAQTLFLERSPANASLRHVAEALGVSFWSVYRQYETRECLFRAAIPPLFEEVSASLSDAVRIASTVRASIFATVGEIAQTMRQSAYRDLVYVVVRDGHTERWLEDSYRTHLLNAAARSIEAAVHRSGSKLGHLIGIDDAAAVKAVLLLEAALIHPRVLPGMRPIVDDSDELCNSIANQVQAATFALTLNASAA